MFNSKQKVNLFNFNIKILDENKIIFKENITNKNIVDEIKNLENKENLSDEECTLSEDEKVKITNVPIFKSKRFTSFNMQNYNTEIELEQIDKMVNNKNINHNANKFDTNNIINYFVEKNNDEAGI